MAKELKLGNVAKCRLTGFTGVVIAKVEYINGCIQYGVRPRVDKDNKFPDAIYIDAEQLEFVKDGIAINKKKAGGESTRGLPR